MAHKFKLNDKIALKEDPSYRGVIIHVQLPSVVGDTQEMYAVSWKTSSHEPYYYASALIGEAEADKIVGTVVAPAPKQL